MMADLAWGRPSEPFGGLDRRGAESPCPALYSQSLTTFAVRS